MKRMLFNATQQEELRVAIVDGQKLIDIDIETAGREQRKSNIYKGVITRIEPSLEACFVNYGEERHGFLPFKEVARSYFREGCDVRNASIKEALREGQEIMVQVEKEERGNKGAALTSFVSLAGRYLVLMPNNPRGGGVSRRVEGEDRQELRETMDRLDLPSGMSVIARTAGIGRNVEELQWDLNYLMQLWRAIEGAGKSAPGAFLIYQESSLVIRAIRDYFQPDIGEILIDTDDIYDQAQQFMSHVMPDMVHRVKRYRDDVPLFSRFQIEHQIETAYSRTVPLPSGGSIVIDHTEALVSVDVNSARATRGSDIETTAFHTNCEAAEEVARQLRLRDLGGLIVIDFIDMENAKNQREVETRLKDALHYDRARVQMGKISRFGLMELSRQRLRPSLSEGSHVTCPRCNGTGHIRDTESSALQVLRIIQEEAMKENSAAIHVQAPVDVSAFLLNEKRGEILKIETRHRVSVVMIPNKHLETPHYKMERLKHDDPRLEGMQASYNMAEQAETDIGYSKGQKEEAKPRQEAMVKGITPDQPAPIVERKPEVPVAAAPAAAPAEKGFFGKIMNLFRKKPEEPAPAPTLPLEEARTPTSRDRSERNGRGPRGRNNGRGGRNGRDRGDEREDAVKPAGQEPALAAAQPQQRPPRPPKEPREAREPKDNSETPPRQRQPRNREERKETPPPDNIAVDSLLQSVAVINPPAPSQEVHAPTALVNAPTALVNAEVAIVTINGVPTESDSTEEPRRRRRRGGRNRNRRDRDVNETVESAVMLEDGDVEPGADHANGFTSVAMADSAAESISVPEILSQSESDVHITPVVLSQPEVTEDVAVSEPVVQDVDNSGDYDRSMAPEQTKMVLQQEAGVADIESPSTPSELPAEQAAMKPETTAEVIVPQPLQSAATPETSLPESVADHASRVSGEAVPAQTVTAASLDLDGMRDMLSKAGLTLASTDPDKMRAAQEQAAKAVPTTHAPRVRKPLPPPSSEPLIQVETHR